MKLIKDIKNTLSSLLQAKSYLLSVILTMAITLGALVSTFNLNYQLLEAPLPYPDEQQLYVVQGNMLKQGKVTIANALSMPSIVEMYHKHHDYFTQQGLFTFEQDIIRSLDDTPLVNTAYVGPEFLQMLQVPMAKGRVFNASEGIDAKTPVAVISYQLWSELFNKAENVLDKSLQFGEITFKIIGVTGKDFIEPQIKRKSSQTQVWLPWDFNLASDNMRFAWNGMERPHGILVKVAPNTDTDSAGFELSNLYQSRFKDEMADQPFFAEHGISIELNKLRNAIVGDNTQMAIYMFIGALAVVLIATANIVNLILSRVVFKQRTFAIHAALGAQQRDIFYELLLEIAIPMFAAAVLSLVVATGGFEVLKTVSSESLPRLSELAINWQSIAFALLCTLVLTVAIALLVTRQINYRELNSALKSSGKGSGIQISKHVRQSLVVAQVALTGVVLVLSVQLLLQSFSHIFKPLDFNSDDITEVILNIGLKNKQGTPEIQMDARAIRDELMNHPDVVSASVAHDFPISSYGALPAFSGWSIHEDKTNRHRSAWIGADENFQGILGLKLLSGRNFTPQEVVEQQSVIIISDALAKKIKPDGDLLNEKIYWASSPYHSKPLEVIGIFESFTLLDDTPLPYVLVPRSGSRWAKLLVQFKPGRHLSNAQMNKIMANVSSQYKVSETLTLKQAHKVLLAKDTLTAWLASTLAFFALALSAIGMYGVLSYNVQVRRYELGIRMAIGARPATVFVQMLKDNLIPTYLGLVVALAIYAILWRWSPLKAHVGDIDPVSWVLVLIAVFLLTTATTLASVWQIISKRVVVALRGI